MLYALATREILGASVIHDRNPVFVRLADGAIRNAYTVRILNKTLEARVFRLSFSGVTVASLELVEEEGGPAGLHKFIVGPDQTREIRALVTSYQALPVGASVPLTFTVTDTSSGARAVATDHFRGP